jgi:hypothetical protein
MQIKLVFHSTMDATRTVATKFKPLRLLLVIAFTGQTYGEETG